MKFSVQSVMLRSLHWQVMAQGQLAAKTIVEACWLMSIMVLDSCDALLSIGDRSRVTETAR